jgi:hypothetical protein
LFEKENQMAKVKKKKKSAPKKATKKKVKLNKGTPYEMEYVWVEPVNSWVDKLDGWINIGIKKLKKFILG